MEKFYGEYPSIELDIAAISDGDVSEIKNSGVENYFAPNSGLREKINATTMIFSEEQRKTLRFGARDVIWMSWLGNKPSTLLIIVSLPHDPDMPASPAPDPRIIMVPIKQTFIFAPTVYLLVEPKKLVRVKKTPIAPEITKKTGASGTSG
ncbi:MAG: hypothetical protein LBV52_02335 [Spirochaetaceae bacterium]|nr:hypothetical protein [Spirochaetaceae bacterium]